MRSKFTWIVTLLMALMINISFAQERTVTGTVSDATGPLPGVTVMNKSTSGATQTDLDGKYSIKAKQGEVLEFSFVGMQTASAPVGATNLLNFKLQPSTEALDEVVVTGYGGGVKRSNLTGSVSVVSAETIENKPIASFDQILQGSAPGLYVAAGSGQPGDAAKVRIRGTHSINGGSDPLYIMDGVPILAGDFAALNPNDFESVSVLKDAASTSIYGSRGSSGVILITTKKGKFNSKTSFKYSTQYGISERGKSRLEMMNAQQKMTYMNYNHPGMYSDADLAYAKNHSTNWLDVFFRTGITKTQDLSVSGGDDKTRFYSGLSYYDQEGILLRSALQRFTYRFNLEHKASERARFGTNMSIGYAKSSYISSEGGAFTNNAMLAAVEANPIVSPYKADGTYNTGTINYRGESLIGGNNLEHLMRNINRGTDLKIVGNAFAEVEIFKNITAKTDLGIDYVDSRTEGSTSPETYFGTQTTGQTGSYGQGNSFVAQINATNSLRYHKLFGEKHDFSVALFTEYFKLHSKSFNFTGYGINQKVFGYPTSVNINSDFIPVISSNDIERGLFSYFGTANYTYDDRFSVDATFRRDASSRFSDNNKWGTFWAVGGSWNIKNESFLENVDWTDELKLRVSYGTTGNQSGIGDFQQQGTWGTGYNYGTTTGVAPETLGNSDLVWESANKFNIGADFSFFKSWISGSVDYYNELTSDLFISQSLSATSGFGSIDANAGKMTNKGVDVALKVYIVKNKDFSWNINGNFNYNKNKITSLGQVDEYESGTSIVRVGLPLGTHYFVGFAGVDPANGQPLYLDANGDVTTTFNEGANSLAIFGSSEPKYTGGFGTDFNYKGFGLSALFTFAADYYLYNNSRYFFENSNSSWDQYNQSQEMLNIWRNPGDITNVQSANYNVEASSKFIENASFTRLRNVTASYTFPSDVISRSNFFTSLRIYLQAQNLYTWTNFRGYDPESDRNLQLNDYPTPRTITVGFDFKF